MLHILKVFVNAWVAIVREPCYFI